MLPVSVDGDGEVTPTRRRRVLVIDDEEPIRSLLVEMLETMNVDADAASSGVDGLGLLARNRYDLLLTDHVMPAMTGLQVIEVARRAAPDMPVALLSGLLLPQDVERLDVTGVVVLTKPMSMRDFRAAMEKLLGV